MRFTRTPLHRRTLLRGLGVGIALPFLESMMPSAAAADVKSRPKRLQVFYTPNGMTMDEYRPVGAGPLQLSGTLQPLEPFRDRISVFSGLGHPQAAAMGDANQ